MNSLFVLICRIVILMTLPVNALNAQTFYVATNGLDAPAGGTLVMPWQTVSFAIDQVPDNATIEVAPGTYVGRVRLDQQFINGITIRSSQAYQARLRYNDGAVVICFTCQGVTLEGFDIAHSVENTGALLIQIQDLLGSHNGSNGGTDAVVSNVTLRNNIFHDSTNNDILKINNGAENILVEGNMFYNQSGSDEHIDINSVIDVTVQDNIFFNSLSQAVTSSFIVIKDSNGTSDTVLGTRNTKIRRNIFLNWQGNDGQSFVRIGEDGTSNFEADGVIVENNLFLGNSSQMMRSTFTVQGSRNVLFHYNTVVGNLPSRSFAARLLAVGANQQNEQITLNNNIWSDPDGTMGVEGFNGADVFDAPIGDNTNVTLNNNLYYNGGNAIPADTTQEVKLANDTNAIIGDPLLPTSSNVVLPVWNSTHFGGGALTIREAFTHLATTYAKPAINGAGTDQGVATQAPIEDLLGNLRSASPDVGAFELDEGGGPPDPAAANTFCIPIKTNNGNRLAVICL